MTITPLGERVLITMPKNTEKTSSGIYIPKAANENKKEGVVVTVGLAKDGKKLPLQPGDRILYGGYSNEEFDYEGTSYIIIDYKDVLAKLS